MSTKTKGAEDCKEFLLTKPTKRNDLKHVTAASTFTSSCTIYISHQSNLMLITK